MGCSLEIHSIGIEPELNHQDLRINTRFRADPKAFILYGLLKNSSSILN